MSKYKMEDGSIVNTDKATKSWGEELDWDGNNHISRATGSQWDHEELYRSSKGRYYLEHTSQWQDSRPHAEFITNEEAALWLLANDYELPQDLKEFEEQICE